jgi:hypothetical protein
VPPSGGDGGEEDLRPPVLPHLGSILSHPACPYHRIYPLQILEKNR